MLALASSELSILSLGNFACLDQLSQDGACAYVVVALDLQRVQLLL